MSETSDNLPDKVPSSKRGKGGRAVLNALGSVPFAGGLFSAAAGYWGEQEEAKANEFLRNWIEMIHDEIREKEETILEIMSGLDLSRFRAAPSARLSHLSFESDGAFPAQC